MTEGHRRLLLALRAFNIETGRRPRKMTTEDSTALLGRIAFWRECVSLLGSEPSTTNPILHPVFQALQQVNQTFSLDKYTLSRVLNSREKDIKARAYYAVSEVEEYAEGTSGALLYCHMHALGIDKLNCDHVASHVGKAYGLSVYAKSLIDNPDTVYIPQDLLQQHGLTQNDASNGLASRSAIEEIVGAITDTAKLHTVEAQRLYLGLESRDKEAIKPILLPYLLRTRSVCRSGRDNDGLLPLRVMYYAKLSRDIFNT
jgi:NADH dehydrogenase [ubiquinone] 1 alpha subcomplex assembly factor 6